jgi:hypothetical protein
VIYFLVTIADGSEDFSYIFVQYFISSDTAQLEGVVSDLDQVDPFGYQVFLDLMSSQVVFSSELKCALVTFVLDFRAKVRAKMELLVPFQVE